MVRHVIGEHDQDQVPHPGEFGQHKLDLTSSHKMNKLEGR